jgi:hypothetical protein
MMLESSCRRGEQLVDQLSAPGPVHLVDIIEEVHPWRSIRRGFQFAGDAATV